MRMLLREDHQMQEHALLGGNRCMFCIQAVASRIALLIIDSGKGCGGGIRY